MHQFGCLCNIYKCMASTNSKQHALWIEIKKYPNYNNALWFVKITSFWYHSKDTKRNPWVMLCSHCPINDSPTIYTVPFTLQLCYKPLGILEMVTKSQKVHISSHDILQIPHNISFGWHRSQGSPERGKSSRYLCFTKTMQNYIKNLKETLN